MTDLEEGWFDPETSTFGDRIAGAREAAGMSQSELARRLGVRLSTLRGWEDDRSEPRANKLQMMAGLLNVSLVWLLNGVGEGAPTLTDDNTADITAMLNELRDIRLQVSRQSERMALLEKRLRKAVREPV
ncbi:helix-turn-helix domain-containing protein [Pseudooceanicola sp.]|jgi:transcriptional regulator with XRE-family HTH domain|uniref:helix-turn-helix domain-containing protein n=1 Tax=Pseudooceanicola sp. TaxID=1914328 RepID=UPI0040589B80